ncbi:hypothetical protein GCM10014713_66660 [Streptomyces purpureus]|uniref:Uncharacterized protein n=1 Tax=Streptomyces purpureus TaxID=1951 RepID=A0A918LXE4_9ACTN|nr:hypothetical protein GCM10014713_66660 [Streptomyces purpureus]
MTCAGDDALTGAPSAGPSRPPTFRRPGKEPRARTGPLKDANARIDVAEVMENRPFP